MGGGGGNYADPARAILDDNGFQNAQLLALCIAASSRHKLDTLKATISDLSGADTLNH